MLANARLDPWLRRYHRNDLGRSGWRCYTNIIARRWRWRWGYSASNSLVVLNLGRMLGSTVRIGQKHNPHNNQETGHGFIKFIFHSIPLKFCYLVYATRQTCATISVINGQRPDCRRQFS